jgi:hypothetical protein
MANDNYPALPEGGSYACVIDANRDTERSTTAAVAPEFLPMLCSFNPAQDPAAANYVREKLAVPGNPWKGVGEVHLRSAAYQLQVHADNPAFVNVCKEAALKGVPVFIHWDPRAYPKTRFSSRSVQLKWRKP